MWQAPYPLAKCGMPCTFRTTFYLLPQEEKVSMIVSSRSCMSLFDNLGRLLIPLRSHYLKDFNVFHDDFKPGKLNRFTLVDTGLHANTGASDEATM